MAEESKKWFFYGAQGRSGPYSDAEVTELAGSGQIPKDTKIWKEGMIAPLPIATVMPGSGFTAVPPPPTPEVTARPPVSAPQPARPEIRSAPMPAPRPGRLSGNYSTLVNVVSGLPRLSLIVGAGVLLLALAALSRFVSFPQYDVLSRFLNQPAEIKVAGRALKDMISPADYQKMALILTSRIGQSGTWVHIAHAMTPGRLVRPFFVIGTNLPDRTWLGVLLTAEKSSLAGPQYSVRGYRRVRVMNGLAVVQFDGVVGASRLPPAMYQIDVFDLPRQPPKVAQALAGLPGAALSADPRILAGRKAFSSNKFFLGGVLNPVYRRRLAQFQSRMRQREREEREVLVRISQELRAFHEEFSRPTIDPKARSAVASKWARVSGVVDGELARLNPRTPRGPYWNLILRDEFNTALRFRRAVFAGIKTVTAGGRLEVPAGLNFRFQALSK